MLSLTIVFVKSRAIPSYCPFVQPFVKKIKLKGTTRISGRRKLRALFNNLASGLSLKDFGPEMDRWRSPSRRLEQNSQGKL